MYLFSIPDSSIIRLLNYGLLDMIKEHKEWFYDNFQITTAYGCPPSCRWNGGRVEGGTRYRESDVEQLFEFYKERGIIYRLNFTNMCLEKEDLEDEYGNMIANVANQFGAKVAVTLPMMADYLQQKYPKLQVTWSTSTDYGKDWADKISLINKLSEKSEIVLPYTFNNKEELKNFLYPQNLEILIYEGCADDCPMRKIHEDLISKTNHAGIFNFDNNECILLKELRTGNLTQEQYNRIDLHTNIVRKNNLQWYDKMGINKFKISGRVSMIIALVSYNYYFVKRQYRDMFNGACEYRMNEINKIGKDVDQDIYIYTVPLRYSDCFLDLINMLDKGGYEENDLKVL